MSIRQPVRRPLTLTRKHPSQSPWRKAFTDPETFTAVLATMVIDKYGMTALAETEDGPAWAPEALRLQLEQDFNIQVPKQNLDKLMAASVILGSDVFWHEADKFVKLCNILSGDDFDPDVFDPADSVEMAWAITEVMLLDPPETPQPFSEEIQGYIGYQLQQEGFVAAPDVLKIGLSADMSANIADTFADDPEMFQAMHESQIAKKAEVEGIIQAGLQELMLQLQEVPLQNGSLENLKGERK